MTYSDDFYTPPGSQFEPGDVFSGIPFPSLKFPLTYFRIRSKNPDTATVFDMHKHGNPEGGDSPKCSVDLRTVMLVSHGCEVDRVLRYKEPLDRRHWLAAPILPLSGCSQLTQQRTRDGTQPNRFYLPPSPYTDNEGQYADLRKITPINCRYFLDTTRVCSITEDARKALFSRLGVFFSGYSLYLQPIECPACKTAIDPSQFQIPSSEEADTQ